MEINNQDILFFKNRQDKEQVNNSFSSLLITASFLWRNEMKKKKNFLLYP